MNEQKGDGNRLVETMTSHNFLDARLVKILFIIRPEHISLAYGAKTPDD
jgi:hypothetical protein